MAHVRTYEPIPKPEKRVEDPVAREAARRRWCEWCDRDTRHGGSHVHHVRSRGARGGDVPDNLISLCWRCHGLLHDGNLGRAAFDAIVGLRNRLLGRHPDGLVYCTPCGRLCRPQVNVGGRTIHCHRCAQELPAAAPGGGGAAGPPPGV